MLYILLPVHNRKELTAKFIHCLQQQTFQNYHLLLIDDGSTDGSAEMVQSALSSVTVLHGNGSWWWAGSLHQGYLWLKQQHSTDDYLVILNNDVTFGLDYLQIGVSSIAKNPKSLLCSIGYSIESGKQIDGGIFMDWQHWKSNVVASQTEINCASTRGLFLHVADFISLGGFYPRLLPHYTSDYEFTQRAYRRGYRIYTEPSLVLYFSEKTSGIYNFNEESSYISFLKKLFSKKYTLQPFYLSVYVALACPWKWKIKNWVLIWSSTLWKIIRYFFIINYKHLKKKT